MKNKKRIKALEEHVFISLDELERMFNSKIKVLETEINDLKTKPLREHLAEKVKEKYLGLDNVDDEILEKCWEEGNTYNFIIK